MPTLRLNSLPRLYFLVSPREMTGVTTEVLSEDFAGRLPISLVKAGHLSAGDNTVVQLAGSSHGAIMDSASTRGAKLTRNLEPCDLCLERVAGIEPVYSSLEG